MTKRTSFNFENTISSLTDRVNELESGELSLEESLQKFEQGIGLTRKAQAALEEAEQKVQLLLQDGNDESSPRVEDFIKGDESDT